MPIKQGKSNKITLGLVLETPENLEIKFLEDLQIPPVEISGEKKKLFFPIPIVGVAQTVFLVNRVFVPCQKGHFDENGENDEFAVYPLKTRVWLLRPPKTTKMTKMAGVTQEKAWFWKGRVCSSHSLILYLSELHNMTRSTRL